MNICLSSFTHQSGKVFEPECYFCDDIMENELLTLRKFLWTPILQVVVLCCGTLVSFLVALGNKDVSIYLPFISETGAHVPESCIFSFTLYLGSVIGSIAVCFRYLIMKTLLATADRRLLQVNGISTAFGLLSMAGLAGVAAFPVSSVFWVHILAAVAHFVLGTTFIILQTFINHFVPGASLFWKRVRVALCVCLIVYLSLLVVLFPLSFFKWKNTHSHLPAKKTPDDALFGLMFSSALFEWLLYGTFLAYMATFYLEFKHFHLKIGVIKKELTN